MNRVRRCHGMLLVSVLLAVLLLPACCLAASMKIANFDGFDIGPTGTVVIDGAGVRAVAVQPWDGKVVIGGEFTITGGGGHVYRNLARINSDGSLDETFVPDPDRPVNVILIVKDPAASKQEDDKPIPPQPEARIYVGGEFTGIADSTDPTATQQSRHGLARLRSGDGSLDAYDEPLPASAVVKAMVLDRGGASILVGGSFSGSAGGNVYNNLVRISIGTMSINGTFSTGTGGEVAAIAVQDKMVLAGGSLGPAAPLLARFAADGSRDTAFAPLPNGAVRALAVQPDGMVLVAGDFTVAGSWKSNYLARLRKDGSVDTSFVPPLQADSAEPSYAAAVVMQPDGGILVGGKFTIGGRQHLARVRLDGALDDRVDFTTDGGVSGIALEPNGRFLAGGSFSATRTGTTGAATGTATSRTRLVRFYTNGALDEDTPDPCNPNDPLSSIYMQDFVASIGQRPDGSLTVAGRVGYDNWVQKNNSPMRLRPDWTLDPALSVPKEWEVSGDMMGLQAQFPEDDSLVAGGPATEITPLGTYQPRPSVTVWRFDNTLTLDTAFTERFFNSLYDDVSGLFFDYVMEGAIALARLPPHWNLPKRPDGTESDEGMVYVGGYWPASTPLKQDFYLARLNKDGSRDTTFNAPAVTGAVKAIHILPDDRLLLAGEFPSQGVVGGLMRLQTNGAKDESFSAPGFLDYKGATDPGCIYSISVSKNGKSMLVAGDFTSVITADGKSWDRTGVARLTSVDGDTWELDLGYRLDLREDQYGKPDIITLAPKTNGDVDAIGGFDEILDESGWRIQTGFVSLDAAGKPYPAPAPVESMLAYRNDLLWALNRQPDGKLIVSSLLRDDQFWPDPDGIPAWINGFMERFRDGWATEELTVADDGTITWMRAGTSPEVWGVYFEDYDSSSGKWNYLGRGKPIDGGWQFTGAPLAAGRNGYVRARAYLVGNNWEPTASIVESVRLYYIREPLHVVATAKTITYGEPEPPLEYTVSNPDAFLAGDSAGSVFSGSLTRVAGQAAGSYAIGQGSLSCDSAYQMTFTGADLTIKQAAITVVPTSHTKTAGEPDPLFDYSYAGLVSGDGAVLTGSLGRADGETPGNYLIKQGTLSAGPNYTINVAEAYLTIEPGTKASQSITFTPRRFWTYGDADFDPGATSSSGLPVSYAISNDAVFQMVNGKVKVLGKGDSNITASQPGDDSYLPAAPVQQLFTVDPAPGRCLDFDGFDDYAQLENAPQLNFGSKAGFTIEMWLLLTEPQPQPQGTTILSKTDGGTPFRGYRLVLDGNRISAEIGDGSSVVTLTGITQIDLISVFHHVALSVDREAGVARLYVDAKLEAKITDSRLKGNPDNVEPLFLGKDLAGEKYFMGEIDELRLWSVARSTDEIRNHASFILDPADYPDLQAYYHFDEGGEATPYSTVAPDRTAHGANMLLHNFDYGGWFSDWATSSAFIPLIEILAPTASTTSMVANGIIYPSSYQFERTRVCWGESANPAYNSYYGRANPGSMGCSDTFYGPNPFSVPLPNNAVVGSTYHIQAWSECDLGTGFSNDYVFVMKGEQVITFGDITTSYGAGAFDPGATSTGPVPISYTISDPAVAKIVDGKIQVTGVGSATITASQAGDASHLAAADVKATLTVKPATLSVVANARSKSYGQDDPPLDYLATGYVYGDDGAILTGSLSRDSGETPGRYAIVQGTLGAGANYAISFTGAELTIAPAVLTVSAKGKSKTYGSADPTFDYTATGYVNGETGAILTGALARVPGEGVGSYPINQGTLSAGGNYTISFNAAKLTIDPATLSVTASATNKSYGAADPLLDFSASGFVNGDIGSTVLTGSLQREPGETTGSYAIGEGSLSAAPNYTISFTGASLTITPATLTVSANDQSKAYGSTDPPLDYSATGFMNGDTAAIVTGSLARDPGETAGNYIIRKGNLSAGGNYVIDFGNGILTITPATLTVSANDQSKAYGSTEPLLDYSCSGFINGDTASVMTGCLTRASGEGVGSYAIGQGSLNAGVNYVIAFTGAKLTITPATLTVTANSKTKSYGTTDPLLDYSASGFVNGDTAAILTGTLARAAGEEVGGYAIGQGSLSAGANYVIAFTGAKLSITTTAVAVTANSKTKSYGTTDPLLDYSASGFVNGDTAAILTGTLARAAGEEVGGYAIDQGSLSAGANYVIAFTGASLSITPATLTVTANAKTKKAGEPDPALDFTAAGFRNGDSIGIFSGTLVRAAGESAGVYAISQGSLSAGANYTISYTGASLTIEPSGPAPQVISFEPMRPKTFGDGDFDPGATASSGLPVSYASSNPLVAAVVNGRIRVVAPGSAEITASQGGNAQFLPAADVTRPLLVNPPPWNGLGFDGIDDRVTIGAAPQLDFGAKGGFTIESWLHLDGSQADGTALLSKGDGGSSWRGYQLSFDQDRIAAEIGTGGASIRLVGSTPLADGQWHHVALAVDREAGSARLYLDGRLEAEISHAGLSGSPDNGYDLLVGVDRGGSRFFKGEMDELRLWDAVRSREEIRAAVSQIIDPANERHLVAYFHLDEGDAGDNNIRFPAAPDRTAYEAFAVLDGFALAGTTSNWIRSGAFLPLLETAPVTGAGAGAATGGGFVYPNYYPATVVGLCWGSSANPGLGDSCLEAGSGSGAFTGLIGGLAPGATYHVRAFAVNAMGTAYGNDVVFASAKLSQEISFTLPGKTYGDPPFSAGATSTSTLPISYTSSNPAVATVVNGEITITGAGTSIITASQKGDGSYAAAADVPMLLTVAKAPLSVTADRVARAYQTPNPPLTASYRGLVNGDTLAALSGSPLLSTTATPASPVGDYPITVAVGTLSAANYSFVLVDGTLSVLKSCQEIIFPPIPERTYGDPPIELVATACSGLAITFSSSNQQVARVSGNVLAVTGAGSAVITASQQGSDSVEGAPDVSQTVIVHKSGQSISLPPIPDKLLGDAPFSPGASASSGLPVSYESSDPSVATTSGGLVSIVGAGTTVITATQQGNANYNAAFPASQPLTVAVELGAPEIALSTLSSGAVTADPVLNVTGSASDATGIASLSVNGEDVTGEAAAFSSAVPLKSGQNSIEVVARDAGGNRSTRTVNVSFDAAAPALSAATPADNSVTFAPFFTITGSVTPGSAVSMTVNGTAGESLAVADGRFSGSGYLQQGVNTIMLTATLSGRVSSIKRSVTLAAGRPAVAITEPVEDLRSEQASVVLRGTASAQEGAVTLVLEVNGTALTPPVQSGAFQQEVVLSGGQTRVRATVTDSSGKVSVARRNIIKIGTIRGDANGDGLVDISDAQLVLRMSLGLDAVTPEALSHADLAPLVNGVPQPDGRIDVEDLVMLLRSIVGLVDF